MIHLDSRTRTQGAQFGGKTEHHNNRTLQQIGDDEEPHYDVCKVGTGVKR